MKATQMAAETGAGVAFSVKSGLLGGFILLAASVLGTVIGFKVVPPTKGKEMDDISTRLLCGLLSSCTLGFYSAYRYMQFDPEWLAFWVRVYQGRDEAFFLGLLSAGLPFVLLAALPGFWIVAAVMRWFQKREGKDIAEMAGDAMPGGKS